MKTPFRSPYNIQVTQEYGNTSNNAWYLNNGITAPWHTGIDVIFGNPRQTFGTEIVCPFDKATVIRLYKDDPHSTKGNGVIIRGEHNRNLWDVILWHSCKINVELNQELKLGDIISWVGNSGLCFPARDILHPFNGSHCHLGVRKYNKVNNNWVLQSADNLVDGLINPRELFDFSLFYTGEDTGFEQDMWGISDLVSWMTPDIIVKYFKYLGF